MIEMQMEMELENERVERLRLHRLGNDWIQVIKENSLDRLEQLVDPKIDGLLLLPKRVVSVHNAGDLVANYHDWFDDYTNFQLEESRVSQVGERLGIFYRFHLQQQGDWYAIEQQLYCILKEGRVEKIRLLCSGFQLVGTNYQAAIPDAEGASTKDPIRDELLEFHVDAPENGSTCALLTPAIKLKFRGMQTGQILEVRVDDPDARGDIEAWSRLSGNTLLKMVEDKDQVLRFFLKKK